MRRGIVHTDNCSCENGGDHAAAIAVEWREVRVLCLGLDGAGKTSLLGHARLGAADHEPAEPTTGFHVHTVTVRDWKLLVWDVGGVLEIGARSGRDRGEIGA